jgi:hypothetical protein
MPVAISDELSAALLDRIDARADIINPRVSVLQQSSKGNNQLEETLDGSVRAESLLLQRQESKNCQDYTENPT